MKAKLIRFVQLVVALAVLGTLGGGTYELVQYVRTSPSFEVKKLSVSGSAGALKRVTENEIVSQAEFEIGTNVFRVGLEGIRQRVERLQWVRYATVERILPDHILIKVAEREPIGLARIRGEVFQFDADAVILELDPVSGASFPILDGLKLDDPSGNLKKVATYRRVLDELGQPDLSEVHINDKAEVSVVAGDDPMLVSLGATDYKARWLKYLQLKSQIQQKYPQAVRVDLRFKDQVIVRMKADDDPSDNTVWDAGKKLL
jgi:cell division protein FtsQ